MRLQVFSIMRLLLRLLNYSPLLFRSEEHVSLSVCVFEYSLTGPHIRRIGAVESVMCSVLSRNGIAVCVRLRNKEVATARVIQVGLCIYKDYFLNKSDIAVFKPDASPEQISAHCKRQSCQHEQHRQRDGKVQILVTRAFEEHAIASENHDGPETEPEETRTEHAQRLAVLGGILIVAEKLLDPSLISLIVLLILKLVLVAYDRALIVSFLRSRLRHKRLKALGVVHQEDFAFIFDQNVTRSPARREYASWPQHPVRASVLIKVIVLGICRSGRTVYIGHTRGAVDPGLTHNEKPVLYSSRADDTRNPRQKDRAEYERDEESDH